jgi:hypothetical protein
VAQRAIFGEHGEEMFETGVADVGIMKVKLLGGGRGE